MKWIIVFSIVASALFGGSIVIADTNGSSKAGSPATASGTVGTSAAPGGTNPGSTASETRADPTTTNDRELKDCLVRKRDGNHSMSQSDREQACRAEIKENSA